MNRPLLRKRLLGIVIIIALAGLPFIVEPLLMLEVFLIGPLVILAFFCIAFLVMSAIIRHETDWRAVYLSTLVLVFLVAQVIFLFVKYR